ncbi:MAG: beta-propeller domain-containing protein [Candidatus Bathyarchaeota archaeon]|nr:beta-propeller domain-containing protein [Candidatus Bathyarchaeota archaeon]
MVQKEIRKKTPIYGLVGILSAIILLTAIYAYGPTSLAPVSSTGDDNTIPPAASLSANEASPIQVFSSYDELNSFLSNTNAPKDVRGTGAPVPEPAFTDATSTLGTFSGDGASIQLEYSGTNIQVAGVDEADSIKTDGQYLYVLAENTVYILDAGAVDPQNAQIIAKIPSDNTTNLQGIYLSQDGNKLAVIGSHYATFNYENPIPLKEEYSLIAPPYWNSGVSFVEVYDVSVKTAPTLSRNFTLSGNYFSSRMIGDYVYFIVTEYATLKDGTANLPTVFRESSASNIEPAQIFYVPDTDSSYTYTTIVSLNIMDDAQNPRETTVMMGGASTMYVSTENIYITYPNWNGETQDTSIYRISINEGALNFEAQGSVVGYPINQYAMDEYNGYFRIATTTWFQDNATTSDGAVFKVSRQMNSIYVLDMNLNIVGKLEGFKMDESLYSARFMGDKCYIVTFKQIDPFFVIDLSNPTAPVIAGELKIPGYSSYLHPMDENHLIGLGKENSTLKLSLFDVSNVNAPVEVAKYMVDADYSDSSALYDPHAFLYDAEKQMLVIPVSTNQYLLRAIDSSTAPESWQGAYVFHVDATTGFTVSGTVTQVDDTAPTQNDDYYWRSSNLWITRAMYIDNTLYTFSNSRVQLNSLTDFSLLSAVNLD